MSALLRVLLFLVSVFTAVYISRKLRYSQIQIMDAVFWIGLSFLFVILSVFPRIAIFISKGIGIDSPANFVFLVIIFLLLIKCFLLSIKVSQMEDKLNNLVQEIAIRDNQKNNERGSI